MMQAASDIEQLTTRRIYGPNGGEVRNRLSGDWEGQMQFHPAFGLMLIFGWLALLSSAAPAAGIDGVWASDASLCSKIFVRKGNSIALSKNADLYGSGFIIERGKIRSKVARCSIKATKEDGAQVHMLAACATDVMYSDMQLSVRVVDQNKIVRIFPGLPDVE